MTLLIANFKCVLHQCQWIFATWPVTSIFKLPFSKGDVVGMKKINNGQLSHWLEISIQITLNYHVKCLLK